MLPVKKQKKIQKVWIRKQLQKNWPYIAIIILVGLGVYFNSLSNGFVLDDFLQIVNNKQIHSMANLSGFLKGVTFGSLVDKSQVVVSYYRPLMILSFSIIYSLFGPNPFYFHLVQLFIHIANSVIVFFLFLHFFTKKKSLFLSLIFLVHPVNVESVASIPAFQEVLYMFFGLLAIISTLSAKKKVSLYRYLTIFFLLLFSLFSKESGIIFVIIVVIQAFLLRNVNKFNIIITAVFSVCSYAIFRLGFAGFSISPLNVIIAPGNGIVEKFINYPKMIFSYIQVFTAPVHLVTSQVWTVRKINLKDFYLPLFYDILIAIVIIGFGRYLFLKQRKWFGSYLLFLSCFLVGIVWHLNIDFLDAIVADRWFYLPAVGALGLLGIFHETLKIPNRIRQVGLLFIIIILVGLSIRTIVRTTNWKSTYSIVSHDIRYHKDNWWLQYALASEYLKQKKYDHAIEHYVDSYKLSKNGKILSELGIAYQASGREKDANDTFQLLLKSEPGYWLGYLNYGYFVLGKNPQKAKELAQKGLNLSPRNPQLLVLLSLTEYKLGNYDEAISIIEEANSIAPDKKRLDTMNKLKKLKPVSKD